MKTKVFREKVVYKIYGIKRRVKWFTNNTLFDAINKTDTETIVEKSQYKGYLKNGHRGYKYMATWGSELKKSFLFINQYLGKDFEKYVFVDIGSGKGKAILLWKKFLNQAGKDQEIFGIEYYKPFVEISKKNYSIVHGDPKGIFVHSDAAEFNYNKLGDNLILYLFNPFDEVILRKVLDLVRRQNVIIVYYNPKYIDVLFQNGYTTIDEYLTSKLLHEHLAVLSNH